MSGREEGTFQVIATYDGPKGQMSLMLKEFHDWDEAFEMMKVLSQWAERHISYTIRERTLASLN